MEEENYMTHEEEDYLSYYYYCAYISYIICNLSFIIHHILLYFLLRTTFAISILLLAYLLPICISFGQNTATGRM